MPTADAAVEYKVAAAEKTTKEVDDTVLAVADLADHGTDQHKECDDERIPQAQREHQNGKNKARDSTKRGVGVAHGIAPDGGPGSLDETHSLVKIRRSRVIRLGCFVFGINRLACRRSALVDRQARRAGGLFLVGITHRKPPRSGR